MNLQCSRRLLRGAALALAAGLLAACGGGGGGGGSGPTPTPTPSVSLSANPAAVGSGQSTTLSWSSTAATSCTASGGWSGAKGTSGSETVGPLTADTTFTLACSGLSGSSASQSVTVTLAPPPSVTFSATPASVVVNHSATLTWSATNASACTASGAWSGTKATAGTESSELLAGNATFTLSCDGPGGSTAASANVTVTAPPAGTVVISGQITFDRVPFRALPARGLNPDAPVEAPARQVVVEAIEGAGAALASGTTDLNGRYALIVPTGRNVFIRAHAQMLKSGAAPTWNFRVRNNTNGDAAYVLDGSTGSSGLVNSTRNLHAPSGWTGAGYGAPRAAAPFAILDSVFRAKELILSAAAQTAFPPLDVYWSAANRTSDTFCPDDGLVTTSYVTFGGSNSVDECTPARPGVDGIYLVGDFAAGDTDEFDQHVIAHEFGHYVEAQFSRSDSIGGSHGGGERLDLRVAFGEGWGDAYAAMALGDPLYRDSFDGVSDDFVIDLESDSASAQGWFSEFSVGELLWDIFDAGSEPGDGVALGFAPIFAVMSGEQVASEALTSVFPFAAALRSANPGASAAIGSLLSGESISGNDQFGAGETNDAGEPGVLPVYRDITRAAPVAGLCSRSSFGLADSNKLGNRSFLRYVNDAARLVTIQASGAAPDPQSVAATDPDIIVWRRGQRVAVGDSGDAGVETLSQLALPAGTYVIEVFDFDLGPGAPRCMSVSITG